MTDPSSPAAAPGGGRDVEVSCLGLARGAPPVPCCMVVFGASGDLTAGDLMPALYQLAADDLLPQPFALIGFARRDWDDDAFRGVMREAVAAQTRVDPARWEALARGLFYVRGDFDAADDYTRLRQRLAAVRRERDLPDHVFYHLAAPPQFFDRIVDGLDAAGLADGDDGWPRLVIEKPFGRDEASSRRLDRRVLTVVPEERVYRIDHFLGKETVQNMLVFRFANPGFEPIWNRHHVEAIEVTAAESKGIGSRGAFYEDTGVIRDMVQNHLLQLLGLVALEPPVRFSGDAIRDETTKVLDAIRAPEPARDLVRGQYGRGRIGDRSARAYREEDDVAAQSEVPTYAALRLYIDNWRWAGVPFYLRTGKRLAAKLTQIVVRFRPTPASIFPQPHASRLVFRLQPEEGIVHTFAAKQPGPDFCLSEARMNFVYRAAFGVEDMPSAYAWLLLDVMRGEQTFFARADWIHRAWQIVDPLLDAERRDRCPPLQPYAAGSWGPSGVDALLPDWTS